VKGYLQTVLVHFREPRRLAAEIGWSRAGVFALSMGGAALAQLLVPISWALLLLWFVAEPAWVQAMFPAPVFYLALASLVLGAFALVYLSLYVAVDRGHDGLAPVALLLPAYWLLMSVATLLALVDLVTRPHHWHKTEHGLYFRAEEVSTR
jgi:hypothetical protein